jgi:transcriptional regulator with XRE-family HTH domain
MISIKKSRERKGVSQRRLATLSELSYKTIQLIESGEHDTKLSTLQRIAKSLGYPPQILKERIASVFKQPVDSIVVTSERILRDGEDSWKIWLFEFVDSFRRDKDSAYIDVPPVKGLSKKMHALLASVVETLCAELKIDKPWWCNAFLPLELPWFVSGIENLKAIALIESPIYFRKRNIFVLDNFLSRR